MITPLCRRLRRRCLPAAVVVATLAVGGCSVSEQTAPGVFAPSEFTLAVTTTAVPDVVTRDGSTSSVVTLTARDPQGGGVAGQRVRVSLGSATPAGTRLSETEVTTDVAGRATFAVVAPPATSAGDTITVVLTPIGENFANAVSRSLTIAVRPSNPNRPVASFTVTPAAPTTADTIAFNAAGSTDEGAACGGGCTYTWSLGDGTTATGIIATRNYATIGQRVVTLTVTDAGGAVGTSTQTVSVVAAPLPTAPSAGTLTFGPTPVVTNATVNFDAGGATVGVGATLVDYTWFWGDGSSNSVTTGPQAQHAFGANGVYTVRVTVRDSLGRTAAATVVVTVT